LFGEVDEHLRGREFCVVAFIPGDFEFVAAQFGGPEAVGDDSHSRGDLLDGADASDLEGFGGVEI